MTREELKKELQMAADNEFKLTNTEVAEAFPGTHDWYPTKIITNFEDLTPWVNGLGWVAICEMPVDQTLNVYPDIIFKRV